MSIERQVRMRVLLATTRAEAEHICQANTSSRRKRGERIDHALSRAGSIRILERLIGLDAVSGWLAIPQPTFEGKTAGEMLAIDPQRVLRHLQWLESGFEESEVDEAAADPIHDHRPQSAPKRKVNRVLSILDELVQEAHNRRFMD